MESIVQKLVGVVWIDEQARGVAGSKPFSETAKIGGGLLASLDKGTNLVIEQTKINDKCGCRLGRSSRHGPRGFRESPPKRNRPLQRHKIPRRNQIRPIDAGLRNLLTREESQCLLLRR